MAESAIPIELDLSFLFQLFVYLFFFSLYFPAWVFGGFRGSGGWNSAGLRRFIECNNLDDIAGSSFHVCIVFSVLY